MPSLAARAMDTYGAADREDHVPSTIEPRMSPHASKANLLDHNWRQRGPMEVHALFRSDQQHPTRSAVVSIAYSSALMPLRIPDTIFNIRPLETAAPIVDGPWAHAHIGRVVQRSPY
jgi:hypothetical protein